MHNQKALLIIDMQKGSFTSATPRYDAAGVVKRINVLAKKCRKKGFPVIFIQHDGTKENVFIPNTEEWKLLEELHTDPRDLYVSKTANDIFYETDLNKILKKLGIEELFITGCATDFCVESTVQSALAKDFHLTIVKNGHTTADRPHLSAWQVIEHYNWIWQNMISTKGNIKVVAFEDIII